MKPITLLLAAGSLLLSAQGLSAQTDHSEKKGYWNAKYPVDPLSATAMLLQGTSRPI